MRGGGDDEAGSAHANASVLTYSGNSKLQNLQVVQDFTLKVHVPS